MGRECAYGFGDLHRAHHGRPWTDAERRAFEALGHDERNARVRELAAGSSVIRTATRPGSDGLAYEAFWVELPGDLDARLRGPRPAGSEGPDRPGVVVVAPGPVLVPGDVDLVRAEASLATRAVAAYPSADGRPRHQWWIESIDEAAAVSDARSLIAALSPRAR